MKRNVITTRKLAIAGMLTALTAILVFTPIGMVSIGAISLTTIHIPVLIGTLAEGPVVGLILALVFGLCSFIKAFQVAGPLDPFFTDPLVSIPSRLLIPLVTWGVFCLLSRLLPDNKHIKRINWAISSAFGSITNTVATLFMLYLRQRNEINALLSKFIADGVVSDKYSQNAGPFLISIVGVPNGITEMIIAVLLVPAVLTALHATVRKPKVGLK
jgi:uncharacterized membrane protein